MSPKLYDLEWHDSFHYSPPKADGRIIYFTIAIDNGNIDDSTQSSFTFKGTNVLELTRKLKKMKNMTAQEAAAAAAQEVVEVEAAMFEVEEAAREQRQQRLMQMQPKLWLKLQ